MTRYRKYDGDSSCAYRELLTPLREPGGLELSSKTTPAAADVNTNQLLVIAVNLQMFTVAASLLHNLYLLLSADRGVTIIHNLHFPPE